ncbi:hypothetical protein QEH42_gp187 [Microbacterium phage Pumpernickel]|uniref:Uncharacterized protein n=1 Tax=Microbacterium phage Pumpernickel TaxID=2885983 RepID=A0AAE9C3J7_9CAUD|nr:hypothetical protein QEH42_gp187 [Microbacterium phage Pumpernickel]UDL16031.1 hypothetical protein SEA_PUMPERNICKEL_281 [Microbacterium phage Pumpernickel]
MSIPVTPRMLSSSRQAWDIDNTEAYVAVTVTGTSYIGRCRDYGCTWRGALYKVGEPKTWFRCVQETFEHYVTEHGVILEDEDSPSPIVSHEVLTVIAEVVADDADHPETITEADMRLAEAIAKRLGFTNPNPFEYEALTSFDHIFRGKTVTSYRSRVYPDRKTAEAEVATGPNPEASKLRRRLKPSRWEELVVNYDNGSSGTA